MSTVLWEKFDFSPRNALLWLCVFVCTSVTVFHSKLSQLGIEENKTAQHMFVLPRGPCHPLFLLSLLPPPFPLSPAFSPRSSVENAASLKPPALLSKSPKNKKSNPTLLLYSLPSLHSSPIFFCSLSSSPCQTAPPNSQKLKYSHRLSLLTWYPLDFLIRHICMCLPSPSLSASVCHWSDHKWEEMVSQTPKRCNRGLFSL